MCTLRQCRIQLHDGFLHNFQEPKNKRCDISVIARIIAEFKRIIILRKVFFYGVRKPVCNERVKFLRQQKLLINRDSRPFPL